MDAPIGQLIRTADAGDDRAAAALFTALYRELHTIAERQLRQGGSELTLGTTTLLHEAYLDIADREGLHFATRGQFLAYAARAMRGLTIDYVRQRRAKKRGGEFQITHTGAELVALDGGADAGDLVQLGEALDVLGGIDPELAQLVDLHFFCGFTFGEVAELRGVSERTVHRDWRKARLLLHRTLEP
ncbi:MAG TPA: ECF-type sigma factor [Gemmatimonadales bacterium]|nr:ECF-type sigma factor [Gemmatimonadales bacterium]